MSRLIERAQIAAGVVPVNLATAANDGDWVSLANFQRLAIIVFKGAGANGEPPTLTLEQATSAAGGGAKALNFTRIYKKEDADILTIGQFTKVTQAAANTYALAVGDTQAIVVVEIDAAMLDVDGGFKFVRARIADVGTTAQIGAILYLATDGRYQGDEAQVPSIIA